MINLDKLKDYSLEKFKRVRPSARYMDEMTDFVDELRRDFGRVSGGAEFPQWLKEIEKEFSRSPEGSDSLKDVMLMVRMQDDRVVGLSSIREHVSEYELQRMGGNLSYVIRPSERRKGYNKLNLYMAMKECRERGMKLVKMTCRAGNRAAARSIRAMGGTFVRTYFDAENPDAQIEEYLLNVESAIDRYKELFELIVVDPDELDAEEARMLAESKQKHRTGSTHGKVLHPFRAQQKNPEATRRQDFVVQGDYESVDDFYR